ncbi:MAG: AbrB/MazE/SpoVT family DNA-binding domain-containing protein [archaeon]
MEITKISTKGQVVIPEGIRKGLAEGTAFIVSKQNDLIILKKVEGLTEKEMKEMKELDKIWKDIDEGKGTTQKVEDFLDEMKKW